MTHHLMSMEDALMALYEEPEDMHDLIDYLVEYELAYAKEMISRLHPDCIFHSDSYAANLVPAMIEMGIDIWQGVMTTNNVPELIKKYDGQISFMGDIDSGVIDFPGWNDEIVFEKTKEACERCGKLYFIPGASLA